MSLEIHFGKSSLIQTRVCQFLSVRFAFILIHLESLFSSKHKLFSCFINHENLLAAATAKEKNASYASLLFLPYISPK